MNKLIKTIKIAVVIFVPYIFDFIFLPFIFPDFKSEVFINLSSIFTIGFPILGMFFLTDKLYYWLLSDLAWVLLATLYHPPGIYSIGIRLNLVGPNIGGSEIPTYDASSILFGIMLNIIGIFLVQFAVWVCFKIFKTVRAYLKKKKAQV